MSKLFNKFHDSSSEEGCDKKKQLCVPEGWKMKMNLCFSQSGECWPNGAEASVTSQNVSAAAINCE